jgi:hypothetical protein
LSLSEARRRARLGGCTLRVLDVEGAHYIASVPIVYATSGAQAPVVPPPPKNKRS